MLGFSKSFPSSFFPPLIYFFHHRIPAQATITPKFQGVISQVFSQPDSLWPRRQSDLQSYHEQLLATLKKKKSEIYLATLLLSGEMAAHSQSVDLSSKSLRCRFVWPTKLPCCVMKHGQMQHLNQDEPIRTGLQDVFRQVFAVKNLLSFKNQQIFLD